MYQEGELIRHCVTENRPHSMSEEGELESGSDQQEEESGGEADCDPSGMSNNTSGRSKS